jgi:small GTP-binding protein
VTNSFDSRQLATIGGAFLTKSTTVSLPGADGEEGGIDTSVKIHLWDTAGEERYRAVAQSFFRGAKGALLVFDLTSERSLEAIVFWHKMLSFAAPSVVFMLVGTKYDLVEHRAVSQESALAMVSELGAASYAETSARTGHGVVEAFNRLAHLLAQTEVE